MDLAKKRKAMHQLKIQANYINWQKGLKPKALLKQDESCDSDFKKAFEELKVTNAKLLDIGCGWGYLSMHTAQMGHDVLGIDIAENAIQYAKELALKEGIKCNFLIGNILETNFANSFDVLMDRGCLAIMPSTETELFMEKTHRILKQDGYFLLKIDKGKIKNNPEKIEKFKLFYTILDEWEGHYIRSDEKVIKTNFYIGQKNKK